MPELSPFQRLPLHIAEIIARYYTDVTRHCFHTGIKQPEKQREVWCVLHNISYFWRVLVLSFLYKKITLDLNHKDTARRARFDYLPLGANENEVELYSHVKEVNVIIYDAFEQSNEQDFQFLSSLWPENLVFPSARVLSIRMCGNLYDTYANGANIKTKALCWLAQRVKASLPNLPEARSGYNVGHQLTETLSAPGHAEWIPELPLEAVLVTMKELMSGFTTVGESFRSLYFQNCPGLTSLSVTCSTKHDYFVSVAQRFAPILELLMVFTFTPCIYFLIYDSKGEPVAYPKLQRLSVSCFKACLEDNLVSTGKGIAPFPVIRRLEWNSEFAFADDTLFRGNRNTLEYFEIRLGKRDVERLQELCMISNIKFSRLSHITITSSFSSSEEDFISPIFLMEIAMGLALPVTQSIRTFFLAIFMQMGPILTCPHTTNIRILKLNGTMLNLQDMTTIIKHCPSVTDFGCMSQQIHDLPSSDEKKDSLDCLYSNYYPLSHCLKDWQITNSKDVSEWTIVASVITFAVLCPKFKSVTLSLREAREFDAILGTALGDEIYSEHAGKIKPLFYYK